VSALDGENLTEASKQMRWSTRDWKSFGDSGSGGENSKKELCFEDGSKYNLVIPIRRSIKKGAVSGSTPELPPPPFFVPSLFTGRTPNPLIS